MPRWQSELPKRPDHFGFKLVRTPQTSPLTLVATSDQLLICDTHWFQGRTVPCEREVNENGETIDASMCPACTQQIPWRTHCYLAAFNFRTREHVIFECTDIAAEPLAEYIKTQTTLRGCALTACRPKGGRNSKVQIICNTANLAKNPIPAAPDITRALSVIWRLPPPAVDEQPQKRAPNRIRTDAAALRVMREQVDNAADPPSIGEILAGNGHLARKKPK